LAGYVFKNIFLVLTQTYKPWIGNCLLKLQSYAIGEILSFERVHHFVLLRFNR